MANTKSKTKTPKRLRLSMEFATDEEMESVKQKAKDRNMSVSNYLRSLENLPPLTRGGYRGYPPPRAENYEPTAPPPKRSEMTGAKKKDGS